MTDLTIYQPPTGSDLEQSWHLSNRLCRTEFVPQALRGKPEAVLACILAGRELGIGPMQALQSIHVIQGRPTMSADLMVGLVRRHGHRIRTIERGDEKAIVEGIRADDPEHVERITFTWEDAKRAGLVGKDNWRQYPAAMLWARAVSALCRIAFNDVLHGVAYVPEELEVATPATTVEVGTAEVVDADPEVDGILADGWRDRDEQNQSHSRMNLYLADHGMGEWAGRWLAERGWDRPLSRDYMARLRFAVDQELINRKNLADATQVVGGQNAPTPPPEPQVNRDGVAGVQHSKPERDGDPPNAVASTPPETTTAPSSPGVGRRSSGGSNSPAGEQAKGARSGRGSSRDSQGQPAGRTTAEAEDQAAYEQQLAGES